MRRIVSVAMVLLLVLCAVGLPAEASSQAVFLESFTVEGDCATYRVALSEGTQICGLSLVVTYEADQLELVSSNYGSVLAFSMSKLNDKIPGKLLLTAITTEPLTQAGELLSVSFRILSTDVETLRMELSVEECMDAACDEISYVCERVEKNNPLYREPETAPSVEEPTTQPTVTQPVTQPSGEQETPGFEGTDQFQPDETVPSVNPNPGENEITGQPDTPVSNTPENTDPTESYPLTSEPPPEITPETSEGGEEMEASQSQMTDPLETEASTDSSGEMPVDVQAANSGTDWGLWILASVVVIAALGVMIYYFVFRRRKE